MSNIDDSVQLISETIQVLGVNVSSDVIDEAIVMHRLSPTPHEYKELVQRVTANLSGYGELEQLITQQTTDILINSPTDVWKADQNGLQLTNLNLHSELHVRRLASRLALAGKQRLDEALPFVDALLPDGVRMHAIIPPLALHHTSISLRFPTIEVISMERWYKDSNLNQDEMALVNKVVEGSASSIICGSTGAGKTALLRSILMQRPRERRLVVIEDVSELNLRRVNTVQLQTRQQNSDGVGFVSSQTLVRQSLRMRPDSIVIGEIRGAEIVDFLLTISSGHVGSISTIHAHDSITLKNRVALLAQVAGFNRSFALDLFRESIDVVLQVENKQGVRVITKVQPTHE